MYNKINYSLKSTIDESKISIKSNKTLLVEIINDFNFKKFNNFFNNFNNENLKYLGCIKLDNIENDLINYFMDLFDNFEIILEKLKCYEKNNDLQLIKNNNENESELTNFLKSKFINQEEEIKNLIIEKENYKKEINNYLLIINDYEDKSIISYNNNLNKEFTKNNNLNLLNKNKFNFMKNNFTKSILENKSNLDSISSSNLNYKIEELNTQNKKLTKENYNIKHKLDKVIESNTNLKFKLGELQLKYFNKK